MTHYACPACGHNAIRDSGAHDHEPDALMCAVTDQTGDCLCESCDACDFVSEASVA